MQNFRKIAKLRCREICEPQNREINVSRKFHVIRYLSGNSLIQNIDGTLIPMADMTKIK